MLAFFVAFNVLEAMLPSLVSRIAPAQGRGAAIGVYNTTQTLGVFFGGLLGGWVAAHHGATGVFATCAVLAAVWLRAAVGMRPLAARGQRAFESDVVDSIRGESGGAERGARAACAACARPKCWRTSALRA